MKTILLLPLLALGLAACQSASYGQGPYGDPEPAPYPGTITGEYRANGTEPFWDLTIGRDMVFTDRGNNVQVAEPTPPVRHGFAGETYAGRRLFVNIVHARCSDGMSDRVYPDTVNVTVNGRALRGCGGEAAPLGERAAPPGAFELANTNWRVVSINGQMVPPSGYYFNFMPDRLSGRLGCNSVGAGYSVEASTLRAGALMMTRMACPDMRFENEGTRVLAQPMTISESGDRMTWTNREGTIELLRAR